ncbi:hypothetical protein [Chryseobacterium sp.]|uniref:hypothetical protein n=1 Tax=Chryseobacterium sp. TaxID=1871047 RepID=UPI000EB976FB|nr:hypothetical protein [Chryseobacterium sp.]HCA08113.1 hypothetical protein [Chryseobacterium sp.]
MYKYRFFIEKISVQGQNKTNAELEFDLGVNIISGSSDTGKSYVFKCIDYVFGAETLPKDIPESKGYTDLYLQIKTFEGRVFTLHRSLKENSLIALSESSIKHFITSKKYFLGTKNNTRDGQNVSEFLLRLMGIKDVLLKKNSNNKTEKVSFRDIALLTMIDESRITTEGSPVYFSMNNYYNLTFEKSVFKFMLTGNGDNDLIEVEEPRVVQSRIKGKIELIEVLLRDKNEIIEKLIKENDNFSSNDLQEQLNELLFKLDDSSTKLNELTSSRKELFGKLNSLQSDNLRYSELNKRFKLLVEHYRNDFKRLEFILEGEHVFSQLISSSCPVCGNGFDGNHINCLTDEKKVSFIESVKIEWEKVNIKLSDLKQTIVTTEKSIVNNRHQIKELQDSITKINDELHNKLMPIQNKFQEEINLIYHLKERENKISSLREEVLSLNSQKNLFENELLNKSSKGITSVDLEEKSLNLFTNAIERLLKDWNYPNVSSVVMNEAHKVYDIVISGRARSSYGKGVRAILYSAFILALLDYCISQNEKHPGFVILDSPLTTYHSNQQREDGDEVDNDLQNGFFTYLSNMSDDRQVIIFDNKIPTAKVIKSVNYIEFSKFEKHLRKGFFQ